MFILLPDSGELRVGKNTHTSNVHVKPHKLRDDALMTD